ncbi:MAG: chromosomal replication initiator protein DnaA, partial [Clostridiaceae bacterium]|nr:chromosomal replication initiator protein DnaA [Clostridiaceae bacterium]
MSTDINETWYKVTKLLEEEMTSVSFSTWIETIVPVSFDKNTILLEVPSEFNLGIIKSRYKDLLHNALKIVTNRDLEIEFCIENLEEAAEKENLTERSSPVLSILNPKYT